MLKEYFELLMQSKLLVYNKKLKLYKTTERGIEFLELYHKMNTIVFPPNMKLKKR
jgi:predicted transcriptional regulator